MLAIGLIPTVLVSSFAYANISDELTNKTEEQLSSVATNQQEKINGQLQKRQEEAAKLANQVDLQTALNTYLTSNHRNGRQEIYNILLNKKVATPEIQAIYLVDLDGNVVTSTLAGAEGAKLQPTDYFVAAGQESSISVKEDTRDGINKLYTTFKISVNKKESGYINLIFRIDDIVAAVQDYTGLGVTGETVIAAKTDSGSAVSLFPLRFDTDAALKTNLTSLQLLTASDKIYRRATDYRNHTVLLTTKSIDAADWVLATKIDLDEALAPITQLRNTLIIISALFSAAIAGISLYFTRLFTNPILKVAEVAQRFGRGDFSGRVDLKRKDELGELGSSVNSTAQSLQDFVASLEAQRNRLSVIINSTTESILAIDKAGRILITNSATSGLTQLPQEAIVGKSIIELFQWRRSLQDFTIDYNKDGTNTYTDLEYTDVANTTHYLKIIVTKIAGVVAEHEPQTIVTIHDETKSRDLDNMKVDFVSMAAHELRTPLAATRGYLELINYKEGEHMPEDIRNYLMQALKSTSELGSLIDNLLGVTRIERGTLTLRPEKVDLAADVQQAVRNANFTAGDKRITLSYAGPANNCFVIADQIALHEVVNNLINNAIKYTEAGGRVSVLLGREGEQYVVHFKDTGIGIPKTALQNLFTKFYRVRGGLNSGSTGTGLGLFISKSIMERHGGTITVESEEGVGSTFTISIPVIDEKKLAQLQARIDHPQSTTTRGNRGWTTKNIAR